MRFRKLNKIKAKIGGYFWFPCPLCGQEFGGHEWKDINGKDSGIIFDFHTDGAVKTKEAICPDCTKKGCGDLFNNKFLELHKGLVHDTKGGFNEKLTKFIESVKIKPKEKVMNRTHECFDCGQVYHNNTLTECIACGNKLSDISTNENTKEKAMQEFENGQEVEIKTLCGDWVKCQYLAKCSTTGYHVVSYRSEYVEIKENKYIRPVQLICEKAREILKEFKFNRNFKFEANNSELVKEVCSLLGATAIVCDQKYYHYKCDRDTLTYTTEDNDKWYNSIPEPELNLSTGEVVPWEGEDSDVCNCRNCEVIENINAEMLNVMKENDAEIERLNKNIQASKSFLEKLKQNSNNLTDTINEIINQHNDNVTNPSKTLVNK